VKHLLLILVVLACLLAAGCSAPAGTGTGPAVTTTTALATEYMLNTSIRPGDDFYTHVNDAWLKDHPVPADKTYIGTFSQLGDKADSDLLLLMNKAVNASKGSADRNVTLIGQFFRSGMNTEAIDREGTAALSGDLAMIDAINSRSDLTNATVILLEHGSTPLYFYQAELNPKKTDEVIPTIWQGGLGLPDRDYYTRTDNQSLEIQDKYRNHIRKLLVLAGEQEAQAAADADTIYRMEKTLAMGHFTKVENRDPQRNTNLYSLAELEQRYPTMGWHQLASIPGSGPVTTVNVYQPQYLETLDRELKTAPLADWKVYLRYQLINDASPFLSAPFEQENFAFYKTTLGGVPEMQPRWKRVVQTESSALGDLVGREYVREYVDPRTRGMVLAMFQSIRQTFDQRITNLAWMSNTTKAKAREKLAAMGQKIAYPDTWKDYAGLSLSDSYIGNVRSVSAFNFIHGTSGLDRIGKPVDPDVWFMSPQTVNAYYDPSRNEIVFPAAILQPPFFDPDADAASNYGALGWIISHEMTHGFDDQGRQFDKDGNVNDWWTEEDADNFTNRTSLLVTEYNNFEVLPGLNINGNLTLGENIADFGGITLAYHAWKKSGTAPSGIVTADPVKDREFFYAAARIWRENARGEAERNWVYTDPHSSTKYRVNGALFNVPEFYEAFPEVRPGDALYRNASERPVIW
jgi:putative endopeptidase